MKTVEGCRIYLRTSKNDFCLRACSCDVSRNKAPGWRTWMAPKQPEALYDAEQKSIFRVTSFYNFSAFNKNICWIFQGCGLLVWTPISNWILTVLPLAHRNSAPRYNVEGMLQWVPQSRLRLTILSWKKRFVWFVCLRRRRCSVTTHVLNI